MVAAHLSIQAGGGEFRISGSEEWLPAAEDTELAVGDSVRTDADARVSVEFTDGRTLVLEPDTELQIQSYSMTTEGELVLTRVARVALLRGSVSGDVREDLIFPPSVFEIVTPSEIVTIKGTLTE